MTITEILQISDRLVLRQTGKHLDNLQEAIIKGAWEGQTYQLIAKDSQHSESRVRDVGYNLWKIISDQLGENINKSNFRSTFERLYFESSPIFLNLSNNNNFCQTEIEPNNQAKLSYHDLILAPQVINFYNRETELKTLSNWIFNQNIRLISVLGLSGIGKTALVKRFVDLNLEKFEVIIWKNLKLTPSLTQITKEILTKKYSNFFCTLTTEICQLLNLLKQKRCLIILDNVENIFINGQLAGHYQPEYKDYQSFFKIIAETEYQSNVILISQEKCADINYLDQELSLSKCLELSGLNDINILENTGLNNQSHWLQLIQLYEGNLGYLKDVVSLILDVYDGEVADFLSENSLIITQNMQAYFNDLFKRMSPCEQEIILELSNVETAISREELSQNTSLSYVNFINGLQSLQKRYLVIRIKQDKMMFKMSPLFREYLRNGYKN
jgi:hypothetical protein